MEFERRIHGYVYGDETDDSEEAEMELEKNYTEVEKFWREYDEYVQYEQQYRKICDEIFELNQYHKKLYNKPITNKFIREYMSKSV